MGPDFIILAFLIFCFCIGLIAGSLLCFGIFKDILKSPRDWEFWVLFLASFAMSCMCIFMIYVCIMQYMGFI